MLYKEKNILFIHIPKTGGTSISKYLFQDRKKYLKNLPTLPEHSKKSWAFKKKELLIGWGGKHKSHRQHLTVQEIQKYYPNIKIDELTLFCVVRNPWDRAVSSFQWESKTWRAKKTNCPTNLKDFVKYPRWHNGQHSKTQLEFITNGQENLVNFIARFENLQSDFDFLCDSIGMKKQKLPHKNKSKHKHYTEYYDDETREIVAEKYARDIEYFGYKFGE